MIEIETTQGQPKTAERNLRNLPEKKKNAPNSRGVHRSASSSHQPRAPLAAAEYLALHASHGQAAQRGKKNEPISREAAA
jgi:hypothetical protein